MTTSTDPGVIGPRNAGRLLEQLTAALDDLDQQNRTVGPSTNTASTPPPRIPEVDAALTSLRHLADYAGPALTAPLDAKIDHLAAILTLALADVETYRNGYNRVLDEGDRLRRVVTIARQATGVIADLSRSYMDADRARLEAEFTVAALEKVLTTDVRVSLAVTSHPAGLTARQAAATIREAKADGVKATDRLYADEAADAAAAGD